MLSLVNPRYTANQEFQNFITKTMGVLIKDAIRELAITLKETFISKDAFQKFSDQYDKRLRALEREKEHAILDIMPSAKISVEQSQILKDLVKEKATTRKEICCIWKKFRQKFQVESYQNLPHFKFQDALRWVNQL